jgi:hypothetical protein
MKHLLTLFALPLLAAGSLLAVAFFAPLPIPSYQDFSMMYFTTLGRLNGIPIYAYPAQLAFIKTLMPEGFTFHPYPYPPWYALATLWLGFFPIQVAARLWFLVNLAILAAVTQLLTPGWNLLSKISAFFVATLFMPVFGLLVVGQYSLPVLLGVALFTWSAQEKSSVGAVFALLLLTFKPHLGGLIILAASGWLLWKRQEPFARRTIWLGILGGVALIILGFLADPNWPLAYLASLGRYRDLPGVQSCELCISFSETLIRVASGRSSTEAAAWVGLILLLGIGALLFVRYRVQLQKVSTLLALSVILTLLIDPYLLNYDYVLLLAPFFILVRFGGWKRVAFLYLLSWAMLAFGRDGNILLVLMTIACLYFFLTLKPSLLADSGEA